MKSKFFFLCRPLARWARLSGPGRRWSHAVENAHRPSAHGWLSPGK